MSEELKRIYKYVDGHKRVRKENPSGEKIISSPERALRKKRKKTFRCSSSIGTISKSL